MPRWLGDAVMASALIEPLRRLSGRPVEIWAPEHLAPIFAPGESISAFKAYEGKGRHRGLSGARRFGREVCSFAAAVWVVPDSLSSALAAKLSGVSLRLGRAGQGRSPLLSHSLRGLRRDRGRHWIDEKADLLRPFIPCENLVPALNLAGRRADFQSWLAAEGLEPGSYEVLAPGAAFGPAKRWRGFGEYAAALDPKLPLLMVGSAAEKADLEGLAGGLNRPAKLYAGSLDLARLARLCRNARRVISNDSGAMHLAAAAGAAVTGIFLSTDPSWTGPRGERCEILASSAPCRPCFHRRCPLERMICQDDVSETLLRARKEGSP